MLETPYFSGYRYRERQNGNHTHAIPWKNGEDGLLVSYVTISRYTILLCSIHFYKKNFSRETGTRLEALIRRAIRKSPA